VFVRRQAHTCVVSQPYPSHFGHDLAARSLNITAETPAATITQLIFTPWPIVLGQAAFSVMIMVFELNTIGTGFVSPAKWGVLYTFNMIRGLGAVVWMVEDIKAGGKIPSLGVALVMLALLGSCALTFKWNEFHRALGCIGHVVCFAGLGLYTANGILSIVHNGFPGNYITVVVTMGCPDGLQFQNSIFENRLLYCAALQPNYEFKDSPKTALFPGILWIIGLLVVFVVFYAWTLVFLFLWTGAYQCVSSHTSQRTLSRINPGEWKKALVWYAIGFTFIGGVLAAVSVSVMTLGAEESFLDCRDAKQQSYGYTGCNLLE
jgi:hypothetical protein